MKRFLCIFGVILIACCPAFQAMADGMAWPTENLELVSFVKLDSNVAVHLGMSRTDIEKVLGAPLDPEPSMQMFAYEGGFQVAYRDDMACAMRLFPEDADVCPFETGNGVRFGMPLVDAVKLYEPYAFEVGRSFWEALVENVKGEWKLVDKSGYSGGPKNANDADNINRYVIIDILSADGCVDSIYMVEACFAKFLR